MWGFSKRLVFHEDAQLRGRASWIVHQFLLTWGNRFMGEKMEVWGDDLFRTEGETVSAPLHGGQLMEPSLDASVVEGHEGDHRESSIRF